MRLVLVVIPSSHLTIVSILLVVIWHLMLVEVLVSVAVRVISFKATTTTRTTTSSIVGVSLTTTHVLILIILIIALSLTHVLSAAMHALRTSLITRSVLFLYCVYEFGNVIHVFISNCILSFVFGLPEVDSQWLDLVVEKSHCFIEKLNCLLCFFDTLIKYIADLIFWNFDSKLIDFVVFEFD